jgi:hypothetical protein
MGWRGFECGSGVSINAVEFAWAGVCTVYEILALAELYHEAFTGLLEYAECCRRRAYVGLD